MELEECEDVLKNVYNISKNYSLIIFKYDYFIPELLIPIIGYELYHPKNKSKLDLSLCKEELINLNIPVNIDEGILYKYDPNSDYYTDECHPYTTKEGTDILINDRQEEFHNNNMSLCENKCNYAGYENNTKEAKCQCTIKSQQIEISDIINQTDILFYNNFTEKPLTSNMISMKCYDTLFSKDGLLKNIGSYILLFSILFFSVSGIIFYKCGFNLIEMQIKKILSKKIIGKKRKSIKCIKACPKKRLSCKNKKCTNNFQKSRNDMKERSRISKSNYRDINAYSHSHSKISIENNQIFKHKKKKKRQSIIKINCDDKELNFLSYKEALKFDKREFKNFYLSFLKAKHPLIFSFYPQKDYNFFLVKINLFFLFFCIYYFINALFFNEKVIHKIYEQGGIYNISYLLPQILYSFIISHFICSLIKYFSLSERNLLEIKINVVSKQIFFIVKKQKNIMIAKYFIFYIIGSLFLLFLWYYISSFNAVYQNTQIFVIKNCLISFSFSLIYPFIIVLLISFCRKFSLQKNKNKCLYIMSQFLVHI
jgi:hypothetical protein